MVDDNAADQGDQQLGQVLPGVIRALPGTPVNARGVGRKEGSGSVDGLGRKDMCLHM